MWFSVSAVRGRERVREHDPGGLVHRLGERPGGSGPVGGRNRLGQLSVRLGKADWLDGAFSAGDLMMVSVLLRTRPSGVLNEFPNLAAYVARGEARPAYKRAFDAQLAPNTGNALTG